MKQRGDRHHGRPGSWPGASDNIAQLARADWRIRLYVWFLRACLGVAAGFVLWLVFETLRAAVLESQNAAIPALAPRPLALLG
ncbi:hypothetical protein [Azohydromonas caseinilytica]|uniref:Uncharacterized protein n=1 Tax=Azohydromonas caseinilytica TaxID=2728836 RepID=A0A848FGC6_9BURK|nr:hypothetical protein [Azohydromonas caseinilytica]NML18312.1 hypothetical protein [Azohydromonas caseinilytica]